MTTEGIHGIYIHTHGRPIRNRPVQSRQTAAHRRLFAADPALPSLMDPDEEESRWVELDSTPELQIWLLSWPAGTHNNWHDHGESVGAFQVVRGTLLEQTSRKHRWEFRTVIAGEGRSFEHNHLHHLANVRAGTGVLDGQPDGAPQPCRHGCHGGGTSLALLEGLELHDSHRLYAVRAHLLEDIGDLAAAAQCYAAAAARTANAREREYFVEQAARVSAR